MLALFSLLAGAALALVVRPSVSPDQSRYLAMAVALSLAHLADRASQPALSALLADKDARVRAAACEGLGVLLGDEAHGSAVAVLLVWIGDQLSADLATAVAVVFGVRIFQNVAAVRRHVFGG